MTLPLRHHPPLASHQLLVLARSQEASWQAAAEAKLGRRLALRLTAVGDRAVVAAHPLKSWGHLEDAPLLVAPRPGIPLPPPGDAMRWALYNARCWWVLLRDQGCKGCGGVKICACAAKAAARAEQRDLMQWLKQRAEEAGYELDHTR